jgi:hypothetical protein
MHKQAGMATWQESIDPVNLYASTNWQVIVGESQRVTEARVVGVGLPHQAAVIGKVIAEHVQLAGRNFVRGVMPPQQHGAGRFLWVTFGSDIT